MKSNSLLLTIAICLTLLITSCSRQLKAPIVAVVDSTGRVNLLGRTEYKMSCLEGVWKIEENILKEGSLFLFRKSTTMADSMKINAGMVYRIDKNKKYMEAGRFDLTKSDQELKDQFVEKSGMDSLHGILTGKLVPGRQKVRVVLFRSDSTDTYGIFQPGLTAELDDSSRFKIAMIPVGTYIIAFLPDGTGIDTIQPLDWHLDKNIHLAGGKYTVGFKEDRLVVMDDYDTEGYRIRKNAVIGNDNGNLVLQSCWVLDKKTGVWVKMIHGYGLAPVLVENDVIFDMDFGRLD